MKVVIKNTSRYPDHAVRWLVEYAARYVRGEMERIGELPLFDRYGFYVEFRNKAYHAFSGLYFHQLVSETGGYPNRANVGSCLRRVLVKVGAPERFPIKGLTDRRYAEGESWTGDFNDWQECAVGITAHELAHVKYSGRKEGELACDATMHDAVDAFRKDRAKFDAMIARTEQRATERQEAMVAKRSPQAVNAAALVKALRKLEQWHRRHKLAETKLKHYSRLVKKLNNRADKLAQGGVS